MSIKETYSYSDGIVRTLTTEDGKHFWFAEQDIDAIKRHVAYLREEWLATPLAQRTMYPTIYIPELMVEKAVQEGWYHDKDQWTKIINDPAFKFLRIWEGRISGHEGKRG